MSHQRCAPFDRFSVQRERSELDVESFITSVMTDYAGDIGKPVDTLRSMIAARLSNFRDEMRDLIDKAYTSAEASITATDVESSSSSSRYPIRSRGPPSEDTRMSDA
jgi:hypothetical protein